MAERTTVRLPQDLVRRAKHKAASEGRSLTAVIEDGLRRVVNVGAPEQKLDRVLPPVSAATGGLMPGIDLNETAARQEAEDLELAARLR
jgi:predicted transcriptional regulator